MRGSVFKNTNDMNFKNCTEFYFEIQYQTLERKRASYRPTRTCCIIANGLPLSSSSITKTYFHPGDCSHIIIKQQIKLQQICTVYLI